MFIDHKKPKEDAIKNNWVDPTIVRCLEDVHKKVDISDSEYIDALETMAFWLNFTVGINTSIGYENSTRSDKVCNFYWCLERLNR